MHKKRFVTTCAVVLTIGGSGSAFPYANLERANPNAQVSAANSFPQCVKANIRSGSRANCDHDEISLNHDE